LGFRSDWDRAFLAALRPTGFQDDAITAVRITRLEFNRLLPTQSECLLQFQTHADVRICNRFQLRLVHRLRLRFVGDEPPIRDPVMFVGSSHNVLLVDLVCPPAHHGHAVLDRPDRQTLVELTFDQRIDVFRFQRALAHLPIAELVQFIRNQRKHPLSIRLRRKASFTAMATQ
jgi:hypothetical protein